jgi:hypothetical protein
MLQFVMTNRNRLETGTKITCNEAQLHLKSRTNKDHHYRQPVPPIEERRCFLPLALWMLHLKGGKKRNTIKPGEQGRFLSCQVHHGSLSRTPLYVGDPSFTLRHGDYP